MPPLASPPSLYPSAVGGGVSRRATRAPSHRRTRPAAAPGLQLDDPGVDHLPERSERSPAGHERPEVPPGVWQVGAFALLLLAGADVAFQAPFVRAGTWILAVLAAGGSALVISASAEQVGGAGSRRWHFQALAATALMFAEMARGTGPSAGASAGDLLHVLAALLLVASAAAYGDGRATRLRSVYLALDATIVASTTALAAIVVTGAASRTEQDAIVLLAAFAGAGFALLIVARSALKVRRTGRELYQVAAIGVLSVQAGGETARALEWWVLAPLAAPGLVLLGAVFLARSAWLARTDTRSDEGADGQEDSRLRLAPAFAAGFVILLLAGSEATGGGTRIGFFGVVTLFVLISTRLALALVENRQLLRRVERSGVFEVKLRDLGSALLAAADQGQLLALVCRTAQSAIGADAVLLWMVDPSTGEIEAVEVLGPKPRSVLNRRIRLNDPTSLVARVARTGEAEIVPYALSSGASNQFLNVLLHAECLLAVPVARGRTVHGTLVCVDSRNPTAYGAQELAKAELLASQVSVALDNAYQHDLQRRRLDEVTALYRFGQMAHTALSAAEVAKQFLPTLKERLHYTYASVWLRDPATGTLRLSAGAGPGGVPLSGVRPSSLATLAFKRGEPVHAGLGWAEAEEDHLPDRSGVRSQLAVPMVLKHRVVGVVDLESRQPNAYSLNDERLLVSLANHGALAIDNLHLVDETRKVEALRELDRMKSELLSTVSHELRTPLASIKGYATTLLTHEAKLGRADRREFLEIIDSESDRLRELIENLLEASRLEAGMLRIDRAPARLEPVAQEVLRKLALSSATHELLLDWPEDHDVQADTRRLYQVMQNLVSNAMKYSPNGGRITLSGAFSPRELTVSIADEGVGLPARELDRIFDRFHRVGGEVSRRVGGTGLGLAICRGLVEAHGGRIWAESDGEGQGSTFSFTLPRYPLGEATSSLSKGAHDHQEANGSGR